MFTKKVVATQNSVPRRALKKPTFVMWVEIRSELTTSYQSALSRRLIMATMGRDENRQPTAVETVQVDAAALITSMLLQVTSGLIRRDPYQGSGGRPRRTDGVRHILRAAPDELTCSPVTLWNGRGTVVLAKKSDLGGLTKSGSFPSVFKQHARTEIAIHVPSLDAILIAMPDFIRAQTRNFVALKRGISDETGDWAASQRYFRDTDLERRYDAFELFAQIAAFELFLCSVLRQLGPYVKQCLEAPPGGKSASVWLRSLDSFFRATWPRIAVPPAPNWDSASTGLYADPVYTWTSVVQPHISQAVGWFQENGLPAITLVFAAHFKVDDPFLPVSASAKYLPGGPWPRVAQAKAAPAAPVLARVVDQPTYLPPGEALPTAGGEGSTPRRRREIPLTDPRVRSERMQFWVGELGLTPLEVDEDLLEWMRYVVFEDTCALGGRYVYLVSPLVDHATYVLRGEDEEAWRQDAHCTRGELQEGKGTGGTYETFIRNDFGWQEQVRKFRATH
jgi:hypothetical protein